MRTPRSPCDRYHGGRPGPMVPSGSRAGDPHWATSVANVGSWRYPRPLLRVFARPTVVHQVAEPTQWSSAATNGETSSAYPGGLGSPSFAAAAWSCPVEIAEVTATSGTCSPTRWPPLADRDDADVAGRRRNEQCSGEEQGGGPRRRGAHHRVRGSPCSHHRVLLFRLERGHTTQRPPRWRMHVGRHAKFRPDQAAVRSCSSMTLTGGQPAVETELQTAPITSRTGSPPAVVVGVTVPVLGAVVVGMLAASVYRQGAFYPVDAFGMAVASVLLVVWALRLRHDLVAVVVTASLGGLAIWWDVRARMEGTPAVVLPIGASLVGFLAAYLVVRNLDHRDLSRVAAVVVVIGTVTPSVGVAGTLVHWHPVAQIVDGSWRLSITLTSSSVSAVLFVVSILLALSFDLRTPLPWLAVCCCLAGMIAARSPWELLALASARSRSRSASGPMRLAARDRRRRRTRDRRRLDRYPPELAVRPRRRRGNRWFGRDVAVVLTGGSAGGRRGRVGRRRCRSRPPRDPPTERSGDPRACRPESAACVVGRVRCVGYVTPHRSRSSSTESCAGRGPCLSGSRSRRLPHRPGGRRDRRRGAAPGSGCRVASDLQRRAARHRRVGATVAFAVAGVVDTGWHLPALALVGGCAAGLGSSVAATGRPVDRQRACTAAQSRRAGRSVGRGRHGARDRPARARSGRRGDRRPDGSRRAPRRCRRPTCQPG